MSEITEFTGARLKCVDLFAGAGGFSLAARHAEIDVVAAIEHNAYACKTYRSNLVKDGHLTTLYEKDILQLTPSEVLNSHFTEEVACDIVLGGPPCQGFSTHRINDSGVDDPRNELVLRYFEYVAVLRPKVFLMENVPGILWPRHERFLKTFYKEGRKAGYKIRKAVTLDARDYGVPQRRKRVFILGVRSDFVFKGVWPPKPTHGDKAALMKCPKLQTWVAADHVFVEPLLSSDSNAIHMNHSQEIVDVFRATPVNGGSRHQSGRVLPCHEEHSGHKDVYGRIDPTVPGPTMTTACINPSKGRFVHPTQNHGITVRHAARFQTFPDNFVFHGGLTAAGQQIGNAVPVLLGKVLLNEIKSGIQNGHQVFKEANKER